MTTATHQMLDTPHAAQYLGLSATTLETWRTRRSDGPRFVKVGRLVKYRLADLDEYIESRRIRSTAEFDELK